jgi:cation diffusion facilitator CzcD-associated flavoprotein CzcO
MEANTSISITGDLPFGPFVRLMFDVVVIGSGVAGLQAARSLIDDFGITNIVVLEADTRVGG